MNLCKLAILLIISISFAACTSTITSVDRVSAHRIVHTPSIQYSVEKNAGRPENYTRRLPEIDIVLTNTGHETLCGATAEVFGLKNKISFSQPPAIEELWSWKPGGIWFLDLGEKFDCNLPVYVRLSYQILKPKSEYSPDTDVEDFQLNSLCSEYDKNIFEIHEIEPKDQFIGLPKRPTAIDIGFLERCKISSGCIGC